MIEKTKKKKHLNSVLIKLKKFFQKNTRKIARIFLHLSLLISLIIIFLTNYINESFSNVTFDQLYYSLLTAEGTSSTVLINGITYIVSRIAFIYLIIFLLLILRKKVIKKESFMQINLKKKTLNINIFPFSIWQRLFISILLLLFSINYIMTNLDIYSYTISNDKSNLFETYYTNPKDINIKAPKDKQNLIYIYVESMESSMFTTANGGAFERKIVPNLEKTAKNNINFSHSNKLGGAQMPTTGSSWTIAGLVSSSAGIPLKIPSGIDGNHYYGYGSFLPGAYTLGDVLKENGYHNYFFIGSDATFGGREDYFTYHGDYTIYDYNYAKKEGWIADDYYVWWGYEDSKLFDHAKDTLTEIAQNDEPFNFTLLTTGTHFTDGYIDEECKTPFDEKYLNAYYCSDYQIGKFLDWLKKQDFYDDTMIVITGDHLTMQANITEMFDIANPDNYDRTIYNAIINSKIKASNTKNRLFTTYDFYPTILASLGFEIPGNRLGLGTNLFSDRQTLAEELGLDKFNSQLKLKSQYYNDILLDGLEGQLDSAGSSSTASPSSS